MERLYKELENYSHKDYYPFHMPGHKRNPISVDGNFPFERDITEIDGFDNLHHPEGILKKAQEDAARLYHTKESFFSINGSTAAILAAISASVKKGGNILVARNCHKAVYHALYLRDLIPTYIYPHLDKNLGINGGISPSRVERELEENKEIEAVVITSPTYDGVVSDIRSIAEIVHKYNIPLIVDEAHGAHLQFSKYFPCSAVDTGADIVIQSLHKTLPAMTQTAILHVLSDRADRDKIQRFLGVYESSSPSYILMASIDACIDKLDRQGKEMFQDFTHMLDTARKRLSKLKHIQLLGDELVGNMDIFGFDKSKLLFSTKNSSLTGKELYTELLQKYQIQMEMEAEDYVLGIASVGDRLEGFEKLCNAIEEIDRKQEDLYVKEDGIFKDIHPNMHMKQVISISDALEMPVNHCLLDESIGKISAEFVYLYPPGIPIIVPGELITGQFVRNMRRYKEKGLHLQGLSDFSNETINVTAR